MLALFASAILAAHEARADFTNGFVTSVAAGTSTDTNTSNPQVTIGEEITILLQVAIPEGTTGNPFPAATSEIDVTVPTGLDFVSGGLASQGAPIITGFAVHDPDTDGNATSDGDGVDVFYTTGLIQNTPETNPTNSQNDFAVYSFKLVVRESASGSMPVQFDYKLDGTSRGTAEITLTCVKPKITVTRAISPSSGIEVETPFNVTITVTYNGTNQPTIYGLSTFDQLPQSFSATELTALSLPSGFTMRVVTGTPTAKDAQVYFESSTNAETDNGTTYTFSYQTELRRDRPAPNTITSTTSVSARTNESPATQGFFGSVTASASASLTTLDTDHDGLTNSQETTYGTSSTDADSDDDGVADGDEASALEDIDGDGKIGARDPDSDGDGVFDGTEAGKTAAVASGAGYSGTNTSAGFFVADLDTATTTDPTLADTDGDGLLDGFEDRNHNGRKDVGELDPNDPDDLGQTAADLPDADGDGVADIFEDGNQNGVVDAGETDPANPLDAVGVVDTDADGIPDVTERFMGTDPAVADLDSDDDGVADLLEPGGFQDVDGDGLFGIADTDSDNDGIPDGIEMGVTVAGSGTDPRIFRPDLDPTTTTSSVEADTDGDGVPDGYEDLDQNGRVDSGETDPNDPFDGQSIPANLVDSDGDGLPDVVEEAAGLDALDADSDDDGVPDGQEPGALVDTDGDGRIGALDADSDNDGILDGTELGVTAMVPGGAGFRGTAPGKSFAPDLDPRFTTNALKSDSDGDGVPDGVEDLSHDGRVDSGETDPSNPFDANTIPENLVDGDGDGIPDVVEVAYGLDPLDLDSDDDGVMDGDEQDPLADVDGDGRIDALDPDSDGDGLTDGQEVGVTQGVADPDGTGPLRGTDPLSPHFKAAATPATVTNPVSADTDGDGTPDGFEDLNRNGRLDAGESDPADVSSVPSSTSDTDGDGLPDDVELAAGLDPFDLDSDDDGIADGDESGALSDTDGDGLVNAADPDSDGDGILDGTEAGLTSGVAASGGIPGTDTSAGNFQADADPGTATNPYDPDSDGDGKSDGVEDLNRDGKKQFGETDPLAAESATPERMRAQGASCALAPGGGSPASALPLAALAAGLALARGLRRRGRRAALAGAALLPAVLLAAAPAARAADEGFDARSYRPNADGLGIQNVRSPDVLEPFAFSAGAYYDHTDTPAELGNTSGTRRSGLVDQLDALTFTGAVGLPGDLDVAMSLPLVFYSDARRFDDPERSADGAGCGDLRLEGKWLAFTPRDVDFAAGADAFVTVPTGAESRFRGEGRVTAGLHLLAEQRLFGRLRLVGNVGYEWMDGQIDFAGVQLDDRVRLSGGLAFMVFRSPSFLKKIASPLGERKPTKPSPSAWRLDIEASIDAAFRAEKPGDELSAPVEVYGGARLDMPFDLSAVLGMSFNVSDGVGAAEWRVFAGVSYAFGGAPRRAFPGFSRAGDAAPADEGAGRPKGR